MIEVENNNYEIVKDYKGAFDLNEFLNHYTDFFHNYSCIKQNEIK